MIQKFAPFLLLSVVSSLAYAAGGDSGAHGASSGNTAPLIGAGSDNVVSGSPQRDGNPGTSVSGQSIVLEGDTITGFAGSDGARASGNGGGGAGGHGGASAIGGISTGGAGGIDYSNSANGGEGGGIKNNSLTLTNTTLNGTDAFGGRGGGVSSYPSSSPAIGSGGAGGHGGGSVFGGISTGGAAGFVDSYSSSTYANGGAGGEVSGNTITLTQVKLQGADGGEGGNVSAPYAKDYGGGGAAGHGGGSVFGGISTGGAGGYSTVSSDGGAGGEVSGNTITLTQVKLQGAGGGDGGRFASGGGGGAAGHGGGSVFGGISTGGAGGRSDTSANGGAGGKISANTITLTGVELQGGAGGSSYAYGGAGVAGYDGGSVFGGISTGGAGGYSDYSFSLTASGGDGGDVSHNRVTIAGKSSLSGDIYGGISQGGAKGKVELNSVLSDGVDGQGGSVQNNTITLIGQSITIGGSIYGGKSINGDGSSNDGRAFSGNTLNLEGYKGSVQGIYNIEKYNWVLPKSVVNNDTLVTIAGNDAVKLDNTKHTAAMYNDGNRLSTGDTIILIDKVQGAPAFATDQVIQQGHFILYDASLAVDAGQLVLTIGKDGTGPEPGTDPGTDPGTGPGTGTAGRINPTSKAFLEGRSSSVALTNQGADMISDNAMAAARMSASGGKAGMFMGSAGGSSRYKTGSHIDVRDINFALGVSKGLVLKGTSVVTLGVLVEHGQGRYDTYNDFGALGEVRGSGNSHYSGAGVLVHVAGLGMQKAPASNFGASEGLYLSAALRAGRTKNTFDSADLNDGAGVRGSYTSRSNYFSAMVGAGYVVNLASESAIDLYSRYTWGKLGADTVMVGNSALAFGASKSSRLRLGARYNHVWSDTFTSYAGLAVEREFKGDVWGSSSGLDIAQPSLKGNTGLVEVGASMKPWASNQALSLDVGLQGYFGKREGVSGSAKIGYAF